MNFFEFRGKFYVLILLLKVFISSGVSVAKKVTCESVRDNGYFSGSVGHVKTCFMQKSAFINEHGATISLRNESKIKGLTFSGNNRIIYLPDNVAGSFPNLEGYQAWKCNIKVISKPNFAGLDKLKVLWLNENRIEAIANNTFEDLNKLEDLRLCKKNLL